MSFPATYEEAFADLIELEYLEDEHGEVFASALVAPSGSILRVIDDDGNELTSWPLCSHERAMAAREERRAAA